MLRLNNSLISRLLILAALVAFTACSSDKSQDTDLKVFRYNQHSGITSLDPAFSKDQATMWATNQIFDGLVQVNDKLEILPSIAKSWSVSENGLDYQFRIRKNVYFHEDPQFENAKGREVVAADFVYSFQRLLDEDVASPGGWLFRGKVDEGNPFEAPNDSTLIIHLKQPFRPMLGMLTLQYCSVVPHEVVEYYKKDFRKHPIGTGPFQFKLWKENETLIMERNPNFHEFNGETQLPILDAVRVSFIVDRGV